MAITFAYTESTNIVVLTEGTSGTPATFANFVTADRAGTGTVLLDAGSPASDLALTYAVRPVEDLAIIVKCVVANKTAEADFIFITGKDWRGAAQTESIDVTAGNGSYTATKYWSEITTLDCSDGAAGGGNVWDDGDLTVTQDVWGVIWDYGNGQYRVDCEFNIGNGSTATYFETVGESSVLPSDTYYVVANATFTVGDIGNGYGGIPTYTKFQAKAFGGLPRFCLGGSVNFYNCVVDYSGDDSCVIENCPSLNIVRLSMYGVGKYLHIRGTTTFDIKDLYLHDTRLWIEGTITNNGFEGVHVEGDSTGAYACALGTSIDVDQLLITNSAVFDLYLDQDINLIDPRFHPTRTKIWIQDNAKSLSEKYTCNIHVADQAGVNLSGVTVDCEDTNTDAVWTAGTITTDANGDMAEQQITYKQWAGTAETLTTYSPHKFTISKAGYETLELDDVTVDAPIVWHLELLLASSRLGTLVATEIDKDTVNQKIAVFAFNSNDDTAKTGDAANITAQISIDGGATAATDDTNPTELDATDAPGVYIFDLTQAETNGDMIVITPLSTTSGIRINPIMIRTKSYIERLSQRHHGV